MTADENAMYLYSNFVESVWPYDDRGRLVGEDVWEPDPDKADIVKLDPTELPPEDLLALRSVQALEYIASPEARQLLERLSHTPAGRLTEEAALAIERLARTGNPRP